VLSQLFAIDTLLKIEENHQSQKNLHLFRMMVIVLDVLQAVLNIVVGKGVVSLAP
jgi:hypothetical protein